MEYKETQTNILLYFYVQLTPLGGRGKNGTGKEKIGLGKETDSHTFYTLIKL